MHLVVIAIVMIAIWQLRRANPSIAGSWSDRWYRTLFLISFPPLLLLFTAIAIAYMGCGGKMLGIEASWLGYVLAIAYLIFAVVWGVLRLVRGYLSLRGLSSFPRAEIDGKTALILDTNFPYSAQIGFWNSHLVISRGLLQTLDREHLQAVLAHEQAHVDYRDTFWFFWLGWLRQLTAWLPNTEILWQELLLLRELRADCRAAESVDYLLLAESLLTTAKASLESTVSFPDDFCTPLYKDRLEERIDFLLGENQSISQANWHSWSWLTWLFAPLLTIPLHY